MIQDVINNLFQELEPDAFLRLALANYRFQLEQNPVYRRFCTLLKVERSLPDSILKVPFLPIGFFKTHAVITTEFQPELIFESSGTTQQTPSRHYIKDSSLYEQSFITGFFRQYGHPENYCILGLLPSYLERENSSLVYMVQKLMELSGHPDNGFYLHDFKELKSVLEQLRRRRQKVLLIGVTFALLDFADQCSMQCSDTIVMETGGMKGRRKEMIREEVHERLKKGLGVHQIHSEYGMTELLSQAYSAGEGVYVCPPWMKVLVRDEDDPLRLQVTGRGALNIVDLVNRYSCSFLATDDVGEVFPDGSFKVLGRLDNSELRGCSLLAVS